MRSAEQAGFFEHGKERLVLPSTGFNDVPDTKPAEEVRGPGSGDGGGIRLNLDPLLIELLKKIPPTADGWPASQRIRWFKTFAMNVSQIYDGDGDPVEMKIELEETV